MMGLIEETWETVFFLTVALLLAFGLYQTLGLAFGTDIPMVSVVSPSMEPTFERGDMIIIKGASFDEIEEDDVIVFDSKHEIINQNRPPLIHRVIEKNNDSLQTQGDANNGQLKYCIDGRRFQTTSNGCPDGARLVEEEKNITADQIRGKMIAVIPEIAHLKLIPTCLIDRLRYPSGHPALQYTCG